jgi:hypothetical protein
MKTRAAESLRFALCVAAAVALLLVFIFSVH